MLTAKITKIEDQRLTLSFPDGQVLLVPPSALEGKPVENLSVGLIMAVPGSEDAARQKLAKDILNELIQ
ncbi:MAG: hypothetical protein WC750_05790 [Patescibacteria group bacterium]|jgi:hypothetical protein